MRRLTLCGVLLLAWSLGVAAQNNDPAAKELARLAGNWRMMSAETEGKETPLDEDSVLRPWIIKGKIATSPKVKLDLEITSIDPTTTPPTIDLTNAKNNQVFEGIYELKGNRWRLCLHTGPGGRQRPLEFATKDKAGVVIVILEREPK